MRIDGRKKIHDCCGHGASHAKVEYCEILSGGRLHRLIQAKDLDIEPLGEPCDVVTEIGKQDVAAEPRERSTGIARKPVIHDLVFGFHAGSSMDSFPESCRAFANNGVSGQQFLDDPSGFDSREATIQTLCAKRESLMVEAQ